MKIAGCAALLFVLLGSGVYSQQAVSGKIFAETGLMSDKIVKGSPFSADAVNESVQVLADGNRIVRSSTNKLYRNSEGRFRREISGGSGGTLGSFYTVGPGITILDPVGGYRYLLDAKLRTARIGSLLAPTAVIAGNAKITTASPAQAAVLAEKLKAESKAATPAAVVTSKDSKAYVEAVKAYSDAAKVFAETVVTPAVAVLPTISHTKYETRTEELGIQNIEGVDAEGVRTVTTIPAGDIGNERPIEIVYERWYSKELQVVVMSKNSDPRFGEQTYRLTNIVRSEPDPSLFEVPSGFKVLSEPAVSYTITTQSGGGQNQNVVWARSSGQGGTAGTGVSTAPTKTTKPQQ